MLFGADDDYKDDCVEYEAFSCVREVSITAPFKLNVHLDFVHRFLALKCALELRINNLRFFQSLEFS